jgi:hypothetical protein
MTQIFIKVPFASSGDTAVVPEPVQAGGEVSMTAGYPVKYSQDPNTTGLRLTREEFNWLLYMMTTNLRQYQTESAPQFITAADNGGVPFPYDVGAVVYYLGNKYQSKVPLNIDLPTVLGSWVQLDPYNQAIERTSPAFTGTPTAPTQASNDNTTKLATTAFVQAAVAALSAIPKALAQVVFDGDGGISIKSSYNVSSVVRESAGLYTINFATALPNADYGVQLSNLTEFGGNNASIFSTTGAQGVPAVKSTTALRICTGNGSSRSDNGYITCAVFG